MHEIHFDVKLEPTKATHQSCLRVMRRRGGGMFVGKYANSKVKLWVSDFSKIIAKHRPSTPYDFPVSLFIKFRFPHLKSSSSEYKKNPQWKTTRPDLDNMEKVILDSLTEQGFFVDDSIVCSKTTEKVHDANYGIEILIRKIG